MQKRRIWMVLAITNALLWMWFWASIASRLELYSGPLSDLPPSPTIIIGKHALPAYPKLQDLAASKTVIAPNLPALVLATLLMRLLPTGVYANSVFLGISVDAYRFLLTTVLSFVQWYLLARLLDRFRPSHTLADQMTAGGP